MCLNICRIKFRPVRVCDVDPISSACDLQPKIPLSCLKASFLSENSILKHKPTTIITHCQQAPCIAVCTIDRNQKISSGQFNSNLNPIKDLVTNPPQIHTSTTLASTFARRSIEITHSTHILRPNNNAMRCFQMCSSVCGPVFILVASLFFRVIILLQGIKIRQ